MKTKSVTALALAVVLILGSVILPTPDGLTAAGLRGLGILFATIILMVTEALPIPIVMLSMMSALFLLGVQGFSETCASFGNSAVFFMLASFGISAALMNTKITQAFVCKVIAWSKGSVKKLCAGFLFGAAFTSSFISDVPTCVIFGSFAYRLLQDSGHDEPGKSALGRALMIAVPVGAILGGFATPAGNGLNVMVMNTVNQMADANLTFIKWCVVGVPLMAIMAAISVWFILFLFKPTDVDASTIQTLFNEPEGNIKFGVQEVKFAVILVVMIVLWVASSWVSQINITVVSILGVLVMHLPGIELLKGKDFVNGISWDSFIMCGGIIAIGTAVQATGSIAWIVDLMLDGALSWPVVAILLLLSFIPCVIHLATPVAGAIYALSMVPLVTAAGVLGIDPCVAALLVGLWICVSFMQPFDLVYLLTYSYGYYSPKDLIKFGAGPTVILLVLSVIWIPFVCGIM